LAAAQSSRAVIVDPSYAIREKADSTVDRSWVFFRPQNATVISGGLGIRPFL
jgi:hypothetical protein